MRAFCCTFHYSFETTRHHKSFEAELKKLPFEIIMSVNQLISIYNLDAHK